MSAKKQIDFVRQKAGSIFEEPVVLLANILEIANNSSDRNGNGSFSFHPVLGPEALIPEDQVDSIGNVYQVVDSSDLSMHAVESSYLTRQAIFGEALSESPIELFVAASPFDEGCSKILASHFDFGIPLVARLATDIPTLIERCVTSASRQLLREWCCSSPTVDVDGLAQLEDSGIRLRDDCGMSFVQEHVSSSMTSHGARSNSEHRWFELGVFRFHWIILVCPKSIGWLQSERTQVSELFDGFGFHGCTAACYRAATSTLAPAQNRSWAVVSTNFVWRRMLRARTEIPLRRRTRARVHRRRCSN